MMTTDLKYAYIFDFRECCRPAIAIDGTHLKRKYKGILFIATTMDGNDQIFPIAFGVGPLENDMCWTWFLTKLRNVIGCPKDMIIILDRHISIKNEVASVFPQAVHGIYGFYMKNNVSSTYKNPDVTTLFVKASRVYHKR